MSVHIIDAPAVAVGVFAGDTWNRLAYDRKTRTLCGKLVTPKTWRNKGGLRLATVAIDCPTIRQRSHKPSLPKKALTLPLQLGNNARHQLCTSCLTLARMTADARAQAIADRNVKKDAALLKLHKVATEAKAKALAELQELIAKSRVDAQACLDALLEGPEAMHKFQRCCIFAVTKRNDIGQPIEKSRCKLLRWHGGEHVACSPNEEQPIDYAEVLERAVAAHKLEHKSGGQRLWITDTQTYACHGRRPKFCDVRCRFCARVLGERQKLGEDHGDMTFNRYLLGKVVETINVQRHTEICALRYLAGLPQLTDEHARVDDIVGFKEPLPEESFVLEHDQEPSC